MIYTLKLVLFITFLVISLLPDKIFGKNKKIWKKKKSKRGSTFALLTTLKNFDCVDNKKLWKILKEMGIPDHLTFVLRNQYAD